MGAVPSARCGLWSVCFPLIQGPYFSLEKIGWTGNDTVCFLPSSFLIPNLSIGEILSKLFKPYKLSFFICKMG